MYARVRVWGVRTCHVRMSHENTGVRCGVHMSHENTDVGWGVHTCHENTGVGGGCRVYGDLAVVWV